MLKNKEYIGIKINKWTIMDYEKDEHGGKWLCRCECGEEKWQKVCNIKNGKSKMCIKCSGKERRKEKEPKKETIIKTRFDSNKEWSEENTFVGTYREYLEECKRRREEKKIKNRYIPISHDRLYKIYQRMKSRCYNKNEESYKYYGGRGIKICKEWLESYANFKKWAIENNYREDLSIDRIDVNGNYEPNNCRWATNKEQQNNRRNNRYIEYNGKTMTLKEWSEYYNIKSYTLSNRLKRGLTFEQSIQEKVPMVRTEKMKKKMQKKKEERRIKEEERQRIILIKKLKKALKNAMIYKAKELCNNIEKK